MSKTTSPLLSAHILKIKRLLARYQAGRSHSTGRYELAVMAYSGFGGTGVGHERRQAVVLVLCPAIFDRHIAPFGIAVAPSVQPEPQRRDRVAAHQEPSIPSSMPVVVGPEE